MNCLVLGVQATTCPTKFSELADMQENLRICQGLNRLLPSRPIHHTQEGDPKMSPRRQRDSSSLVLLVIRYIPAVEDILPDVVVTNILKG